MYNKMKTKITIDFIVSGRGISSHGPTITLLLLNTPRGRVVAQVMQVAPV